MPDFAPNAMNPADQSSGSSPLPTENRIISSLASKLIDLSKRNRLLNAPLADPTKRGGLSAIPINSPDLPTAYAWISERDRAYPVHPKSTDQQDSLFVDDEAENDRPGRQSLSSSYPPAKLTSALSNMRDRGRASIEERGVNIIFATFGMMEWADPAAKEDIWRAPIILLPVTIERKNGGYAVAGINEETIVNPALIYKFVTEYGIQLDELDDDAGAAEVMDFLSSVEQKVKPHRQKFHDHISVLQDVNVGVFSFAKIAMFREIIQLGPGKLLENEVISSLVNVNKAIDPTSDDEPSPDLDEHFTPDKTWMVVEADSSQMEAVYRSQTGKHLAIQGPPGTGKSQTIVNLISSALMQQKTVLFVAEKRVALDVVKERLDRSGLGNACLVIHPGKTEGGDGGNVNKKAVLSEIERTWLASEPPQPPSDHEETLSELQRIRQQLNAYVKELHKPRFAAGKSVFEVYGKLENLRQYPKVNLTNSDATRVTMPELRRRQSVLDEFEDLQEFLSATRLTTPWVILSPNLTTPAVAQSIQEHLETLNDLELELNNLLDWLKEATGLAWPTQFNSLASLADFFTQYRLDALTIQDHEELYKRFHGKYSGLFKFLFKKAYENDCERLKAYWIKNWTGEPASVAHTLGWVGKLRNAFMVPAGYSPNQEMLDLSSAALHIQELLEKLKQEAAFIAEHYKAEAVGKLGIGEKADRAILEWTSKLLSQMDQLTPYLRFRNLFTSHECEPVRAFIESAVKSGLPVNVWRYAYERGFWETILEASTAESQALSRFSSLSQDRLISEFRTLDRRQIEIARRMVARQVASKRPPITSEAQRATTSEVAILTREFRKKRVKPLRKLLSEASRAVQLIKPCFMMSPLAVSQYLDPENIHFDLVIFDEASQIRMEDALGSIYRGKQVIVVGDEQQLPPTRFFDAVELGDDPDEEVEDATAYESILTRAEGEIRSFRQVRLRWHYRSKNEELIAFSNKNFYDNALYTFPNPEQAGEGRAVKFVYVPDAVYDRGRSRTNAVEARTVTAACLQFAEEHRDWSLGVVTFSEAQRIMILDELERQLQERPELRSYFADDREGGEPFMVKNLELVQGDERDAIFFSFGYGHDQTGVFTQNFGPMNQEAGRRRLNVAVTRARRQVTMVTSVQPEELTAVHSDGVRLMKEYMLLARDGLSALYATPANAESMGDVESPFEAAVLKRLREAGLTVNTQVGCSGYRIDLGIIDPMIPGRYCLAVECDGAAYHSERTARDRDRLRQQVLEGLGWNVIRIWSRSWYENPEREVRRVLDAVKRCAGQREPVLSQSTQELEPEAEPDQVDDSQIEYEIRSVQESYPARFCKFTPYQGSIFNANWPDRSARDLAALVRCQGPMYIETLLKQVTRLWGYARLGDNIRANIYGIIRGAASTGLLTLSSDGYFVYPVPAAPVLIQLSENGFQRAIEEIPAEELYLALSLAIEVSGGSLSKVDGIRMAADMLGFRRVSSDISNTFQQVIYRASTIVASPYCATGRLILAENGSLRLK